jgi:hypothetical protein
VCFLFLNFFGSLQTKEEVVCQLFRQKKEESRKHTLNLQREREKDSINTHLNELIKKDGVCSKCKILLLLVYSIVNEVYYLHHLLDHLGVCVEFIVISII